MLVCICTPCYGGQIFVPYLQSLLSLSGVKGVQFVLRTIANESLITRARNVLVSKFLETEADYLLWIDADIGIRPEVIKDLLESNFDVCGAAYPLKTYNFDQLRNNNIETCKGYCTSFESQHPRVINDFVSVRELGTGCMLIKRFVIESMIKHYADTECQIEDGRIIYGLFDTMVDNKRLLSEDFAFCKRWRDMGGKVWLSLKHDLTHSGFHMWQGNFGEFLMKNEKYNSI